MRRIVVRVLVLAALGVLLLAATGCGGDDDESAADTQAVTQAADTAPAATEAGESEDEGSGDDSPDFSSAENCKELVELGSKVSLALSGTGGSSVDDTKKFLDEFADKAPEEIRDDFRVIADAYTKIADAMADVNVEPGETPSAEDAAKLQEVAAQIDQAELTRANTNITAWVNENCSGG